MSGVRSSSSLTRDANVQLSSATAKSRSSASSLGATADGTVTALRHHKLSVDLAVRRLGRAGSPNVAAQAYAYPNYQGVYRLVRTNTMTPTFTRGPGETSGMFALESAMDELAHQLGVDPIELRLRNHADVDPVSGNPWSSNGLKECLPAGRGGLRLGRAKPRASVTAATASG